MSTVSVAGRLQPGAPWDGRVLGEVLEQAAAEFARHVEEINRINVFPVPDGDSGTNMERTLAAVAHAARQAAAAGANAGELMRQAARAALLGARGNSGVILAEIFRGMARQVGQLAALQPGDMAEALAAGAEAAYRAMSDPVEGTILTAIRAAAEATARFRREPARGMAELLRTAAEAAQEATRRTPELLPILRERGVVDAAAKGLATFLEAAARQAARIEAGGGRAGSGRGARAAQGERAGAAPGRAEAQERPAESAGAPLYGQEVQLLLESELEREEVRRRLEPLGESLLVIGEPGLYRVHIHTRRTAEVLEACRAMGRTDQESVEDLDEEAARAEAELHVRERRLAEGQGAS
ncbi:MAG: DAK2 domain-containing protein [Bacillota bacterium]|nr:DAK2 domain-containing protein [Bacillota bacterium]